MPAIAGSRKRSSGTRHSLLNVKRAAVRAQHHDWQTCRHTWQGTAVSAADLCHLSMLRVIILSDAPQRFRSASHPHKLHQCAPLQLTPPARCLPQTQTSGLHSTLCSLKRTACMHASPTTCSSADHHSHKQDKCCHRHKAPQSSNCYASTCTSHHRPMPVTTKPALLSATSPASGDVAGTAHTDYPHACRPQSSAQKNNDQNKHALRSAHTDPAGNANTPATGTTGPKPHAASNKVLHCHSTAPLATARTQAFTMRKKLYLSPRPANSTKAHWMKPRHRP